MSLRRNLGPAPTRPRHIARVAAAIGLAAAGLTGVLTGCSETPTGPAARPAPARQAFIPGPHFSVAPATTVVGTVAPEAPLARDVTFAFTVQPGGTTFRAPDGSAVVSFPSGFVAKPTTFTVTRKAGNVVGYDFQPSGTFSKPVTITVKLSSAAWSTLRTLEGAYVRDWSQVNATSGTARVNELVPTVVDSAAGTATLKLSHFSGYLVSSGRTRRY